MGDVARRDLRSLSWRRRVRWAPRREQRCGTDITIELGDDIDPNMAESDPPSREPSFAPPASNVGSEIDPDRVAILARRRKFIASAIAGIAISSAADCNPFSPCLKIAVDAGATSGDAGVSDAISDGADEASSDAAATVVGVGTNVVPCLSPTVEPPSKPSVPGPSASGAPVETSPRPCLRK